MKFIRYMLLLMFMFDLFAEIEPVLNLADRLRFLQLLEDTTGMPFEDIYTFLGVTKVNAINRGILQARSSILLSAAVFSPETIIELGKVHVSKAQELSILFREHMKTSNSIQIIKTNILLDQNISFVIFIDSSYKRIEEIQNTYASIFDLANNNRIIDLIMSPLHIQMSPFANPINPQKDPHVVSIEMRTEEAFKAVSSFSYATGFQHFTTNITFMIDNNDLFEAFKKKILSISIQNPNPAQKILPPPNQPSSDNPQVLLPPKKPVIQKSNVAILPPLDFFQFQGPTLPPINLNTFPYKGASVLPYIEITDQINSQKKGYVLLARETKSGLYNDFGGYADPNETSLETAAREFEEESINLVNDRSAIQQQLNANTQYVIVYQPYKFVIYLTLFNESELENLTKNFYSARDAAKGNRFKEKDQLAWVAWEDLVKAITHAKRAGNRKLILPITVQGSVVSKTGTNAIISNTLAPTETIKLRAALVDALDKFVKLQKPYQPGPYPNVLFY